MKTRSRGRRYDRDLGRTDFVANLRTSPNSELHKRGAAPFDYDKGPGPQGKSVMRVSDVGSVTQARHYVTVVDLRVGWSFDMQNSG
jgi:hypothetical protein